MVFEKDFIMDLKSKRSFVKTDENMTTREAYVKPAFSVSRIRLHFNLNSHVILL